MRTKLFLLILCVALFAPLALDAQMLDPAMDRPGEPFSYFSKPTDVIGVMDARAATLVGPEGYLYTGFGELMFFRGNPPRPIEQRVKTLFHGYLPVVEYAFTENGIRYTFTMFAATLDGNPESPVMNFIRVKIQNRGAARATAWFGAAMRYQSESNLAGGVGDNRFRRPVKASRLGGYEQPGVEFDREWDYGFADDAFLRDAKAMYLFPTSPAPERRLTLKEGYRESRKLRILPTTPAGLVLYKLPLDASAEATLDFKMPLEPLAPESPLLAQLRDAKFDDHLSRTVAFWEALLGRGIDISVPEEKLNDTFKANLIYDLIARDKVGDDYIQTVNKFHYHAFWLRDSSYIVRNYDLSGYHDIAQQVLDFYARWQQPDGNFVSQGGQFDGWGQTLWAYGQHYRITRDATFAEKIYPSVVRAVEWLRQARRADPLGVMPSTTPGDNEAITGHVTGHNFWALAGLKNAIAIAEGLGKRDAAAAFRREYDDFLTALNRQLDKITAQTGGYIPPGLEGPGGQDWGNMLSVYPEIVLDPFDPRVTATLKATRAKYQEGIMTYGDGRWLHLYLTMKNTETEIIRGEQQTALEELYAMLAHTSSTHAGFEFSVLPWGTRDFGQNLSPHGWFAAKFRAVVRDMMVREQGADLHLLSCISPAWVKTGASIAVRRAPTNFGAVNFEMRFPTATQAVLKLENQFRDRPEKLVLHLPWFMNVTSVTANGKSLRVAGGAVQLPVETREVRIAWTKKPGTPAMSYTRAVENYKSEYRRRYAEFLRTGK